MKKRLFLHIGSPKTGSTTIQNLLFDRRFDLEKYGFYYPKPFCEDVIPHYQISYPVLAELGLLDSDFNFDDILSEYFSQSDAENYIISDETIYTCPFRQMAEYKREGFLFKKNLLFEDYEKVKTDYINLLHSKLALWFEEIYVLCYIRRQDSFIESNYLEDIKSYGVYEDFSNFKCYDYELDYYKNIQLWMKVFNKENVIVKIYDDILKKNNLIEDFSTTLGINGFFSNSVNERKNVQLDIKDLLYKREINKYLHKQSQRHEFYFIFSSLISKISEKSKGDSILSKKERKGIEIKYMKSNALCNELLGRDEDYLFQFDDGGMIDCVGDDRNYSFQELEKKLWAVMPLFVQKKVDVGYSELKNYIHSDIESLKDELASTLNLLSSENQILKNKIDMIHNEFNNQLIKNNEEHIENEKQIHELRAVVEKNESTIRYILETPSFRTGVYISNVFRKIPILRGLLRILIKIKKKKTS